MAPQNKSGSTAKRRRMDYGEGSGEIQEGHSLFVGNLNPDTTDSDLKEIFGNFGELESICSYPSRNFAFIHFKCKEDAKKAKDGLEGTTIRRNAVKIEYAKPAKPGKQLWIGGLNSSDAKEHLEDECLKFGKVEELKLLRDRNSALVSYFRLGDAAAALKGLNGKIVGGETLRVDYVRSQPSRREHLNEFQDVRDAVVSKRNFVPSDSWWTQPDVMQSFSVSPNFGRNRHQQFQSFSGRYREGPPSKFLWIRYPPSVDATEPMIHNAMILFGEIESITCVPQNHCAFIEFRSSEEAGRAKEGLQGRLFNDPRIEIFFFSSEGMYGAREHPPFFPRIRVPRPGPFAPNAFLGDSMLPHPFERLPGSLFHNPEVCNLAGLLQNVVGANVNRPTWRHLSAPAAQPLVGSIPGSWDYVPRAFGTQLEKALSGQYSPFPVRKPHLGHEEQESAVDDDCCWRGIIAKGGNPVCHARCIPIGKEIDTMLPETVNCSAKTGLDMLITYCSEASSFDVVFFLPDSEDDFASYTEFLKYLSAKSRAGVAKFDDGTTMFIVPPSEFLTQVLKFSGPERLCGVVPKFPQPLSVRVQQLHDLSQLPAQPLPSVTSQLKPAVGSTQGAVDLHDAANPSSSEPSPAQSFSTNYACNAAASQVEAPLTPELIAALTTGVPGKLQSSAPGVAQSPSISALKPSSEASQQPVTSHGWAQEQTLISGNFHQFMEAQAHHPAQQSAQPYNNQSSVPSQYSNLGNVPSDPGDSQMFGNAQVLGSTMSMQHAAISSAFMAGFLASSQDGNCTVPDTHQYHQLKASNVSQINYSLLGAVDAGGVSQASILPQTGVPASVQSQFGTNTRLQPDMSVTADKQGTESSLQIQQLHCNAEANQVISDSDAEKNQRYQSTLQLAANLLLQIQQATAGATKPPPNLAGGPQP